MASLISKVTSSDVDMADEGGGGGVGLFIVISPSYEEEHHGRGGNVISLLDNEAVVA